MRAVAADQLRIMTDECLQTRFCVWIFLNAGAETHPNEVMTFMTKFMKPGNLT